MRWDAHRILEWALLLSPTTVWDASRILQTITSGQTLTSRKNCASRSSESLIHVSSCNCPDWQLRSNLHLVVHLSNRSHPNLHLKKLFQQGPCGVRQDVLRMNERTKNEVQKVWPVCVSCQNINIIYHCIILRIWNQRGCFLVHLV